MGRATAKAMIAKNLLILFFLIGLERRIDFKPGTKAGTILFGRENTERDNPWEEYFFRYKDFID